MKRTRDAASVTSLPQSPKVEADSRTRRYLISMGIRILCFALMVLVTPYGWYTWVFGIAAAVLPYIAVVAANTGSDARVVGAESPQQELTAPPQPAEPAEQPDVLRIEERRAGEDGAR
ncbi:DUF3099 domain-containing protein [Microbacterium sp. NPDC055903]